MEPISAATLSVTASVLKKPLSDLYEAACGTVKQKLKRMATDDTFKRVHKAICAVQKVKTMWKLDKEVKLMTFYYPSAVLIGNQPKTITAIDQIDGAHSFVIQGTVGQGKSIFLRYLCVRELVLGHRVPIFVELRRYNARKPFLEFLIHSLGAYGFPEDAETFEYLVGTGRLVLLLDGFDELDADAVASVVSELETLLQKHSSLQIVVTSRPDSGIENSPLFRVFSLAPLQSSEHKGFLEKTVDEPARRKEILKAIETSPGEIKSLLTTPLLLTLLVIVYNATQQIPPILSQFYEALFHTLGTRHDSTKPGFRRHRASHLGDYDLKRLFEAFCFAARRNSLLVIKQSQLETLVSESEKVTNLKCAPDAFASDITKVTCLMLREGLTYQFVHKSVAEFHAAAFIQRSSEESARRFYDVATANWARWPQELLFLSQIDEMRYLRYFFVPALNRSLLDFGITRNKDGSFEDIAPTPELLLRHMGQFEFRFRTPKEMEAAGHGSMYVHQIAHVRRRKSHYPGDDIEGKVIRDLVTRRLRRRLTEMYPNVREYRASLAEVLADPETMAMAVDALKAALQEKVQALHRAEAELQRDVAVAAFIA